MNTVPYTNARRDGRSKPELREIRGTVELTVEGRSATHRVFRGVVLALTPDKPADQVLPSRVRLRASARTFKQQGRLKARRPMCPVCEYRHQLPMHTEEAPTTNQALLERLLQPSKLDR